jgi:hypothetical protein
MSSLSKLIQIFHIQQKRDWYRISQSQIDEQGGGGLQAYSKILLLNNREKRCTK